MNLAAERERHFRSIRYAFRKLVNSGLVDYRFITFTCWVALNGLDKAWEHYYQSKRIDLN